MDILLIIALALAVYFVCDFIYKKTKISPQIFYLIIGILLGEYGVYHLLGNIEILPNLQPYNSILLMLLFFGSGLSFNVNSVLKAGKINGMMLTLPVYTETLVMATITFLLFKFVPALSFHFGFFEVALVMAIFSNSSPINTIPACMRYNMQGLTGKNRITDTALVSTALDGFTAMPFILMFLVLAVTTKQGLEMTFGKGLLIFLGVIIGFILLLGVGMLMGLMTSKIFSPLSKKLAAKTDKKPVVLILYTLVIFAITGIVIANLGPLGAVGPLLAVGAGIGFQLIDKSGMVAEISKYCSMISTILGAPMIIMFVGARVDFNTLMNPLMIAVLVIITLMACTVKGGTAFAVLHGDLYSSGDKKFAAACFVPKGITLINLTVVLLPILTSASMLYISDFMVMLAAVSVFITFPIGLTMINGAGGKWLLKPEEK